MRAFGVAGGPKALGPRQNQQDFQDFFPLILSCASCKSRLSQNFDEFLVDVVDYVEHSPLLSRAVEMTGGAKAMVSGQTQQNFQDLFH